MNANLQDFTRMKNDELGSFLQKRGISSHKRKKKDRIVATVANRMGISIRPTPEEIQADIQSNKENLLTLENAHIKLPDPGIMTLVWESKLKNLPNTTGDEVTAYVDKRK